MAGEKKEQLWPQRTFTEIQEGTNFVDWKAWDEVGPYIREGDIVVNTLMKSGTTWMSQLILQMLHNGEETLPTPDNTIHHATLWNENTFIPPTGAVPRFKAASAPPHQRRVVKSHLQLDALLFSPKLKYLCVVRVRRDVFMSLYKFCHEPHKFGCGVSESDSEGSHPNRLQRLLREISPHRQ